MSSQRHYYELQICPIDNDAREFYSDILDRTDENAGFDVYSVKNITVGEACEFIPFGAKFRMLKYQVDSIGCAEYEDCHFWLFPRSSIYKTHLIMANSTGVIDSSYRGELKAPVWSMSGYSKVSKGDRLFQIVAPDMGHIRRVRIVSELPDTDRGEGGFGSTGR
jgi:dUTP pyrophosphatase